MPSNLQQQPENFPCRISDEASPEMFICTLGDVHTPLAQGAFSPKKDHYVSLNGAATEDYFKKHRGLQFYAPLNRTAAPTPPLGWCTWMYYGTEVTPDEVLENARWVSKYLSPYGRFIVQIDDGWQGRSRDWTVSRETFPQGMKWLADRIAELGLTPGLWLCPHGQDNKALADAAGCFIQSGTMGGEYTVDPTTPEGLAFIRDLIVQVTKGWGYGYLKLDGTYGRTINPHNGSYGANEAYIKDHHLLKDQNVTAMEAYRRFLSAVREGAGDDVCVGGFCIAAYDAMGIGESYRTGADVDAEWDKGFLNAIESTMNGYYLHNIAWYSDPDCCLLRPPLSYGMAEAWVTLLGITGQTLLFGDRMADLGPERVALMKKILPIADIRPFDLFPADKHKSVFDLKIDRLGRAYDVVAIFNYDSDKLMPMRLDFEALGLDSKRPYHVYDYWSMDYLGQYETAVFLDVPPAACRLITVYPADDFPVLLSTNRHVTQGWPDLIEYQVDKDNQSLSGKSDVMQGEAYTLTFALPNDGDQTFQLAEALVQTDDAVTVNQGRGWANVSWLPTKSGTVEWSAKFVPTPFICTFNSSSYPFMLGARDIDPWTIDLFWVSFGSPAGYWVKRDGELIGYTMSNSARVGNLEYGSRHTFEVGVADSSGRRFEKFYTINVTVGESLPANLCLVDIPWSVAKSGYFFVRKDKSVGGAGLTAGGRRYLRGIGTHPRRGEKDMSPDSRIVYDLKGVFHRLSGAFGIEDANGMPETTPHNESGRALFSILADGKVVIGPKLKVHGEAVEPFDIDVTGVRRLELIVDTPDDDGPNKAPHSNWLDLAITLDTKIIQL